VPQLMPSRADRARLCPRGQPARSDSVGKGAWWSAPITPLSAMRLCPPYKWSHSIEIRGRLGGWSPAASARA